jgi:hypothetical protein
MAKNVTKEIYELGDGKYGYRILIGGNPLIDQPHKPAVGGNAGMIEEEANTLADMVVSKMMDEPTEEEKVEMDMLIQKAGSEGKNLDVIEQKRLRKLSKKGNPTLSIDEVVEKRVIEEK